MPETDPLVLALDALRDAQVAIEKAINEIEAPPSPVPEPAVITVRLHYNEVFRTYYAMGKTWYRRALPGSPALPANYKDVMESLHALYPQMYSTGQLVTDVHGSRAYWESALLGLDTWIAFTSTEDPDSRRARQLIAGALQAAT